MKLLRIIQGSDLNIQSQITNDSPKILTNWKVGWMPADQRIYDFRNGPTKPNP